MRTFVVSICSLALAYAARGNPQNTHAANAPQHAATHAQHAQAAQHASAPGGHSTGGGEQHIPMQAPQHVSVPGGHSTGGGQRFEQTQHSQYVPRGVGPAVQGQRETHAPATTVAQPAARVLTQAELKEVSAQSQGYRSAEQYRKWKETGRLEIPAGVATSQGPTAGAGPGSGHKPDGGVQVKAAPFRPEHLQEQEQLDEAAQSQGYRSAEQYRKWKETGRLEIPAGVATSQTHTAGGGPGSVQKPDGGAQVKAAPFRSHHFDLPKKRAPEIVGATFQRGNRIRGSENWLGTKYTVFRDYLAFWNDRDWWRRHCTRIVFSFGGWYFWDRGWWYPAWGYDSDAFYAYDGPIYGYNDLPPDQVVANVQAALQAQGYYNGPVDGLLSQLTRAAIAAYQRDHGLYITSAIDEPTLASLGMA